ncbi:NAD(P)-binding domain-containing protein [Schumannella soli]|uniref:Flavoprotein n=1 Tax=Schumannella soli TaxID=2590779 RepID=A0A506XWZ4_9MICO|nr:NAD(P)-binding domain-containing protein [Schumannella soli]TPW74202.1 flavoprotein [Schumannella soli]
MTITDSAPIAAVAGQRETSLPVVIIGAGPVGLAAAAQLLERGIEPLVLERGDHAGAAISEWGHIRLFSPWRHVTDAASVRLLEAQGWTPQHPDALPTGHELVKHYLAPLAATPQLASRIRYGVTVENVSRDGMDRTRTAGRDTTPFLIRVDSRGDADEIRARAVIDASGTFSTPNPVTTSGLAPRHSAEVADRLTHGLPDVLGRDRAQFAGRRVVVVGAGHSAANALIALRRLAEQEPGTTITWAIRSADPHRVVGSDDDQLPGRASLGAATRELIDDNAVTLVDRFLIDDVEPRGDAVALVGTRAGAPTAIEADVVVVGTGFRPDLDGLREIRLRLDDVVEAPEKLAPLIDPNEHSCGSVPPHGVDELSHPEKGFWLAGMKSYGRAPTFLLLTGYEQVRSIADELAGRHEEARRIELVLPETGVCSTDLAAGSCCIVPAASERSAVSDLTLTAKPASCC